MKQINTRIFHFLSLVLLSLIIPIPTYAQARDYNISSNPYFSGTSDGLTNTAFGDYWAVNALAAGSAASMGFRFGLAGILSADGEYSSSDNTLSTALLELSTVPLYFFNSEEAFYSNAFSGALMAGEVLSSEILGPGDPLTSYVSFSRLNLAMFHSYQSYITGRQTSKFYDNSSLEYHNLAALYSAPLDFEVLKNPWVWGTALGSMVADVGMLFLSDVSMSQSTWNTGEYYLGETSTTPTLAFLGHATQSWSYYFTGSMGEEALFRGYLYEELKYHTGPDWAKVINALAFSSMHIITDIVREETPLFTSLHGISTALASVALDFAYDSGGLRASTAAHYWSNLLDSIFYFFMKGGVPTSERI